MDLSDVGVLQKDFSNLNKYDSPSGEGGTSSADWNIPASTIKNLISKNNQEMTNNFVGNVFAREVTIPSDTIIAGNDGLEYGGYQAPAVAKNRQKYQKLSITFNETNSSFLDFIIRPWIVNVGYFGLVARDSGDRTVKASIVDVIYLGRTGPGKQNPSIPRKKFRFFNVAPVSIDGVNNQYQSEGLQYAKVDFVYDRYCVMDTTDGNIPEINP